MRTMHRIAGWIGTAVVLWSAPAAQASPLLGSSFNGTIYDIDTTTGGATNPRDTGINGLTGIAFSSDEILYGYDLNGGLHRIDRITGSHTPLGTLTGHGERYDLAADPATNELFESRNVGVGSSGSAITVFTVPNPEITWTLLV